MKHFFILIVVLMAGFAGIFALSKNLEQTKPQPDPRRADEDLYFTPTQLAAVGHDFRGLIADWYWINSLQYVGGKIVENQGRVNINDLKPLNPRLLYPMLDIASTLDPHFLTIYTYGASVLPAIDNEQAVKLLQKGVTNNPEDWQLYHNLGYIFWQMKDYQKAAKAYELGSLKPDAPTWMTQMSANMLVQGSSREFARDVYNQMYQTADDDQTRNFAKLRFMQIESLDERDLIQKVLDNYKTTSGKCVDNLKILLPQLSKEKLPNGDFLRTNKSGDLIDPAGIEYVLNKSTCSVELDYANSPIPPR